MRISRFRQHSKMNFVDSTQAMPEESWEKNEDLNREEAEGAGATVLIDSDNSSDGIGLFACGSLFT